MPNEMDHKRRLGPVRRSSAYSPLAESPYAWFDADLSTLYSDLGTTVVTADGASVRRWSDLSGNNRHIDAPGAGNRGTLQTAELNGMRAIQLDGVDDYYVGTAWQLTGFVAVVVFKASNSGLVYEHSPNVVSNNGSYLYTDIGQTMVVSKPPLYSAKNLTAGWGSDSTWRIVSHHHNGSTHASHGLRINGVAASLTNGDAADTPRTVTDDYFIGSRSGAVVPMAGYFFAFVVLPSYDAAAMARIEAYYATRTGIA